MTTLEGRVQAVESLVPAIAGTAAETQRQLTRGLERIEERFNKIESRVHGLEVRLAKVQAKLEVHDSRLEDIQKRLEAMRAGSVAQFESIQEKLDRLEGVQEKLDQLLDK